MEFNFFIAFGVGVASAFYFGPAFWVLLETSLTKGIRAALAFDFGVILADSIFILICYLGLSKSESLVENNKEALFILGGAALLIYGIVSWINRGKQEKRDTVIKNIKGGYSGLALKGFLLSFMNIMVFFYWLSVSTSINAADKPLKFFFLLFYSNHFIFCNRPF